MEKSSNFLFTKTLYIASCYIATLYILFFTNEVSLAQSFDFGKQCTSFRIENHGLIRFVNPKYNIGLSKVAAHICKQLESGSINQINADRTLSSIIVRIAICTGPNLSESYQGYLDSLAPPGSKKMPVSIILPHKKFCNDTFAPGKWASINTHMLDKKVDWLNTEFFCQVTMEVAYPTDWTSIGDPQLPSQKKFLEDTETICRELRNGNVRHDDAFYRWQQAFERFKRRSKPEFVQKSLKDINKLTDAISNLFK